jgi:methyl-accepting chemotaxis protein
MTFGTIRARLTGTIIIILALFGLAGVMVFVEVRSQGVELGHAAAELGEIGGTELPLLLTIKEVKIDVIQVQQWITDISATRGLDGLNDGLDVADSYAVKFREDIARARQLLMSKGHMEGGGDSHEIIMAALDREEASFGPYHEAGRRMAQAYIDYGPAEGNEAGRRMAQAYIDYGPAEGNKMMSAFDAVAAEIGEATDELVAVVEADVTKNIEHQREIAGRIVTDNKNLLFRVSVVGIIGLVAAAFGGFLLFRRVSGGLWSLQNDIDLLSDFATAKGESDEESLDLKLTGRWRPAPVRKPYPRRQEAGGGGRGATGDPGAPSRTHGKDRGGLQRRRGRGHQDPERGLDRTGGDGPVADRYRR